jgi:hypothetical protein
MEITVSARDQAEIRGELRVTAPRPNRVVKRISLSVPTGGQGRTLVQLAPPWCNQTICFHAQDGDHSCTHGHGIGATEANTRTDVVLFTSDSTIAQALSVAQPTTAERGHHGTSPTGIRVHNVGHDQGPPLLPVAAASYRHVELLVVEAELLDRLTEEQARALRNWVRVGGELAVISGGASQVLGSEFLRRLLPGLTAEAGPITTVFSPNLGSISKTARPSEMRPLPLPSPTPSENPVAFNAPGLTATAYGGACPEALGRVHFVIVDHDVHRAERNASRRPEQAARGGLAALLARRPGQGLSLWRAAPLGRAGEGALLDGEAALPAELTAARLTELDPHRANRPPSWIYLAVVAAVAIGLAWFRLQWERRQHNIFRLIAVTATVNILACTLMFGVTLAARGSHAQYRSLTWLETATGATEAALWRRLALGLGRPGTYRLTSEPGLLILAPRGTATYGDTGGAEGRNEHLVVKGSRWETVLAAEQGVVPLEGALELSWVEGRPQAVRNGLRQTLQQTYLLHGGGYFALGDIPAGTERPVPNGETGVGLPESLLPFFGQVPERWPQGERRARAALLGRLETSCPQRGDFHGQQCETFLLAWGRP